MQPPRAATLLGYAGLLPFFGLAGLAIWGPPALSQIASSGLLVYGVAILSFMGGCRWGFAAAGLGRGATISAFAVAVAPALVGWAALWARPILSDAVVSGLLVLSLAALLISDLWAARTGAAPDWWPALRVPLTIGACLSLTAFGVATT